MTDIRIVPPGGTRSLLLPAGESPSAGIDVPIHIVRGLVDGPTLAAVGGVHGDEQEGPAALYRIVETLDPTALRGTVILIPIANPPAMENGTRASPLDNKDMNRCFPGDEGGTPTMQLAARVLSVLAHADFVLSMHSWSLGFEVVPYSEHQTHGAAFSTSQSASKVLGLAFAEPMEPRPGRLLTSLAESGIPAVECEIGGYGVSRRDTRSLYESVFRRLLAHLSMADAPNASRVVPPRSIRREDVFAPIDGVWRPLTELGQHVLRGQAFAEIEDYLATQRHVMRATVDGWVGLLRETATVKRGSLAASLFVARETDMTGSDGAR